MNDKVQNKLAADLLDRFQSKISKISPSNSNEVHILLNDSSVIPEICTFIHNNLDSRLVMMVCNDERHIGKKFVLRYIFERKTEDVFLIVTADLQENGSFPSIASHISSAHLYEREIKDMFGLFPDGNPDTRPLVLHEHWDSKIRPLRKDFDVNSKVPINTEKDYQFLTVEGNEVTQIPVGPVHAGIIEPGHFRFSTVGEIIVNLETRLFYTHKGVEKLAEKMKIEDTVLLSERIAGDESVANSMAFCQAVEKISEFEIPKRAEQIRVICAELERTYNHLGTLAGISTDAGFAFGASRLNILKEEMMQLNEKITGSRILFGTNIIGGVRTDISDKQRDTIQNTVDKVSQDFQQVLEMLRQKSSLMDRLKNTGTIQRKDASDLATVGITARCVGIDVDTRKDHPYSFYPFLNVNKFKTPYKQIQHEVEMQKREGDALARFDLRAEEISDSISFIHETLGNLRGDSLSNPRIIENLRPYRHSLGYCESHRGQTLHWVMMGENNSIYRYKVRTASFCNWPIIEQVVLNDIVADFPLVNKSLDLSYSGNDL